MPRDSTAVARARDTRAPWTNLASAYAGLHNDDGEYGFTVGADYERRFHRWYGVGVTAEVVFGGARDFMAAGGLFLHPIGDFRLGLLPGADVRDGNWAFVLRVGLTYHFEWRPHWTVAPLAAIDFGRGERILLLGGSMGRIF